MTHDTCDGCLYHIGGQHCEVDLERECADGDHQRYTDPEETVFTSGNEAALVGARAYPKGFRVTRWGSTWILKGEK